MGVSLYWEPKSPRQPKISELDSSIFVNEQVLGLEVSVHDSMSMAVGGTLQNLVRKALHLVDRQGPPNVAHVLFQVELTVLEDQVEFVI